MFDTRHEDETAPRSLLSLAREAKSSARAPQGRAPAAAPLRDKPRPSPLLAAMAEARRQLPAAPPMQPAAEIRMPQVEPGPARPGFRERLKRWANGLRTAPPAAGAMPSAPVFAPLRPATAELAPPAPPRPASPSAAVPQEPDELYWRPIIDPFAVIGTIFRAKWLILATSLVGALAGVAVALSTPKQYLSATELLIDPRNLKLTERDLTEGGLPSDATLAIVENQTRVLTSGNVLNKVVDRLDLTNDPEFNGTNAGFSLSGAIADLRAMLSRGASGLSSDIRRRALAIENLAKSLTVERGGKTFVIWIGVTTHEPEKSALIANTMTAAFLETYGELQSDTAGRAAAELNGRLEELKNGVEAAERAVEAFKQRNGIVDAQGKLITDETILKLNDQLATARARTLELEARAASAKGIGVNDAVEGALPEGVGSNVVTELRSQYAALKSQSDLLSVRLGPRHPQILAVQAQLAGLREQLAAELRRIVSSTAVELRRATQLEGELSARLNELKSRQGALSSQLVTLRELEREAATRRSVYEAFLLRARETGESQGINTANMSVISTAHPPLEPVGPSRAVIALAGLFVGLLAGVGIAGLFGAVRSLRANTALRERRSAAVPAAASGSAAPVPEPAPSLDELGASLRDLHARVIRLQHGRA